MEASVDFKTAQLRGVISRAIFKVINGEMTIGQATAIAVLAKEMTASLQAEVNASKWAAKAQAQGHNFGEVLRQGEMTLASMSDEPNA